MVPRLLQPSNSRVRTPPPEPRALPDTHLHRLHDLTAGRGGAARRVGLLRRGAVDTEANPEVDAESGACEPCGTRTNKTSVPTGRASGGPCGGLEERKTEQPKPSEQAGLTQANRPPRKPVRFRRPPVVGHRRPVNLDPQGIYRARNSSALGTKSAWNWNTAPCPESG